MRKIFLFVAALCCASAVRAAKVDTTAVFSPKMNREIPVLIVSPTAATTAASGSYPVLYLLHGFGGCEMTWQRDILDLRPMADAYGIIFVCPDGEKSWYWDSPLDPASQFETFISQELPDWVDARYPTIPSREGRAITGLSMGGHGAMWIALRHKERFGAAGTTSGGMDIRPFPDAWEMKRQLGPIGEHPERWDAHTVMTAVETLRPGELAIIMDCGYADFFLPCNRALHEKLLARGIDHDYTERPGDHNGTYWATSLPYQVLFFHRWFVRQ